MPLRPSARAYWNEASVAASEATTRLANDVGRQFNVSLAANAARYLSDLKNHVEAEPWERAAVRAGDLADHVAQLPATAEPGKLPALPGELRGREATFRQQTVKTRQNEVKWPSEGYSAADGPVAFSDNGIYVSIARYTPGVGNFYRVSVSSDDVDVGRLDEEETAADQEDLLKQLYREAFRAAVKWDKAPDCLRAALDTREVIGQSGKAASEREQIRFRSNTAANRG